MMGCLFGCFRASASGRGGETKGCGGGDGGQLAHPSVAPATNHEVGLLACLRCRAEPFSTVDELWIRAGLECGAAAVA